MLRSFADDPAHFFILAVSADYQTAIFADRFCGSADFHRGEKN